MNPSLFPEIDLPRPPEPDVLWEREFLTHAEQLALFDFCRDDIDWQQKTITFGGPPVLVPRLLAWFGDVDYAYSGIRHPARPMPGPLDDLRIRMERLLAERGVSARFNSVLMNYYRDGNDSIGMHADDETQLGLNSVIASVSLGAPRTFKMVHNASRTRIDYRLEGGSLLVMKGDTQQTWRHGVAKEPGAGPRINLTYRLTSPLERPTRF